MTSHAQPPEKMSWSQRLNLALEYIEENLVQELEIEEIAKVASCSRFHFHRIFYANFGISCSEYIRRRRLTLAAVEVRNSDKRIIDIAHTYGYDSPNAFTRAFRKLHGFNPSKARSSQQKLSTYDRIALPLVNKSGVKMKYKIVKKPSFNVIGKSKGFDFERFTNEGPKFWKEYVGSDEYKKLYQLANGRPGKVTKAPMLSVYFPQENGNRDEFTDLLGIELNEENSFENHTVPAATYAEFDCTYKTSMKTNRYIYGEWFASTGYERDGNKPDIAAYFPVAFRPMSEMIVRWWIPVCKN